MKGWVADFLDVPRRPHLPRVRHSPRLQRHHRRMRRRPLLRRQPHHPTADGRLPLHASLGLCFSPRPPPAPSSTTSPPPLIFAPWIEELQRQGLTAGCGGGNYCPATPVTRAQMAVLLLNTAFGPGYAPPPATGTSSTMSPWGSSPRGSRTSSAGASPPAAAVPPFTARSIDHPRTDGDVHHEDFRTPVSIEARLPPRPTAGGMRYRWLRQRSLLQGACLRWTGRWSARAAVILGLRWLYRHAGAARHSTAPALFAGPDGVFRPLPEHPPCGAVVQSPADRQQLLSPAVVGRLSPGRDRC